MGHLKRPDAFDAFAADYDQAFTRTLLGQMLRERVWALLAEVFPAGSHILELACGTGEDALWLAQRGVRVTALDGSAEMVATARAKVADAGVAQLVTVEQLSLQALMAGAPLSERYDGVLSNFGGLNTICDWGVLAERLGGLTRSGAKAVLAPMGPVCPWEVGWYLLHGRPDLAWRRRYQPAEARIGKAFIPIWYPAARTLRRAFAPWFEHEQSESLGLLLPPSYLGGLVDRWPSLFALLGRVERGTAHLIWGWGDHYLMVLARR